VTWLGGPSGAGRGVRTVSVTTKSQNWQALETSGHGLFGDMPPHAADALSRNPPA